MKIFVSQVPFEDLILEEEISSEILDLETDIVKFRGPLKVKAAASRISNAVTVKLNIKARLLLNCSRCLNEFETEFAKDTQLNYPVGEFVTCIDLNPDIREEVILEYPIKPLCVENCKGLCVKCGRNLNEGGCNCGST